MALGEEVRKTFLLVSNALFHVDFYCVNQMPVNFDHFVVPCVMKKSKTKPEPNSDRKLEELSVELEAPSQGR